MDKTELLNLTNEAISYHCNEYEKMVNEITLEIKESIEHKFNVEVDEQKLKEEFMRVIIRL